MSNAVLGLGSSGSTSLNSDLITKLKTAESTATLDPITTQKTNTQAELDALTAIESKVTSLLDLVKKFDLYTSGTNIFNTVSASTSGTSVSFDATDTDNLDAGTVTVNVTQLAQKAVYQSSDTISDKTATMSSGTITIGVGDSTDTSTYKTYSFDTSNKTYEELVTEMNKNSSLNASLEQVGDSSYRLIIKSANSGASNALSITSSDVSFDSVQKAQNLVATVDGISYEKSSNKITLDSGLIIKATATGESSITIDRDDSGIVSSIDSLATSYNDVLDTINSYILSTTSSSSSSSSSSSTTKAATISDSSTLKSVMSDIKSILFGNYGLSDEENLFKYGFSFDTDGHMQIDDTTLSSAVTDNYSDLKELFVGYAEKEGIGTKLKTYLDDLDSTNGTFTSYEDKLNTRIDTLTTDYTTASDKLDEKYNQMTSQFAEYTVLITKMENSFASLKAIINDNSSSSS